MTTVGASQGGGMVAEARRDAGAGAGAGARSSRGDGHALVVAWRRRTLIVSSCRAAPAVVVLARRSGSGGAVGAALHHVVAGWRRAVIEPTRRRRPLFVRPVATRRRPLIMPRRGWRRCRARGAAMIRRIRPAVGRVMTTGA